MYPKEVEMIRNNKIYNDVKHAHFCINKEENCDLSMLRRDYHLNTIFVRCFYFFISYRRYGETLKSLMFNILR